MRRILPKVIVLLLLAVAAGGQERTVEQLKAEAEHAESGQLGRLYAQIADRLVSVADKQFTDGESVKAHVTVQEILQYAGKAHDLVIQTRKKMKETEKDLRQCKRRLENMRRTLAAEDRPAVEAVEKQLEQFTQDILESMFAPPKKEQK